MAIKKYNPTTPSRRTMTVSAFEEITGKSEIKSLMAPVKKTEDEEVAQLSAFDELPAQPSAPVPSAVQVAEEAAEPAPEAAKKESKAQKPANKNRVGSMFDLLTFSDI